MFAMSYGRDVSVTEMMAMIGRAKLATRQGDPKVIMAELRALTPSGLIVEFHKAVATLESMDALTPMERRGLAEYASDYLSTRMAV